MSEENDHPLVLNWKRGRLNDDLRPILLKYQSARKKNKKYRAETGEKKQPRYSPGMKDVQEAEGKMLKIARKASRTVTRALDTYEDERSKSAAEKKDGAIEDFPHNAARALSEAMKEASDLPLDMIDAVTTPNLRKQLRRNMKRTSRLLRTFRI